MLLLILLLPLAGCTECDSGAGEVDADAGGLDTGFQDARPSDTGLPDASVPDARVRPDARTFEFCGDSLFKMPFDGANGYLTEQELEGTDVFYSFRAWGEHGKIYRFNLDRCDELELAAEGSPGGFGVSGEVVVYDRYSPNDPACRDLEVMDSGDLSASPLLDSPNCEWRPRTNGRHVSYLWQPTPDSSYGEFRLYDMQLGTDTTIPYQGIKSPNLSERYLVFTAFPHTPGSEGTDVIVRDLATGDTTEVEASREKWQDWIFVWEHYLTWSGAEGDLVPPYHLVLYDMITESAELLLEGDYAVSIAPIRAGLVAYNTSKYSLNPGISPSDIEIHDIESGLTRRVTAESGRFHAARIEPPYLLLLLDHGYALRYDLYVANLEMLGVLDSNGRLIPGDGVILEP